MGRPVSALVSGTGACSVTSALASRYPAVEAVAANLPPGPRAGAAELLPFLAS